jgi:Fe-S cluster biogenesis protein NfuA
MTRSIALVLAGACGQCIIGSSTVHQAIADVWAQVAPIVERLDVFGYPCDTMPSECLFFWSKPK